MPSSTDFHRSTRRFANILLLTILLGLLLQGHQPQTATSWVEARSQSSPDTVQSVIDAVSQAGLTALVSDLSGASTAQVGGESFQFLTRNTSAVIPIQKATQYAYEAFTAAGLSAAYLPWTSTYYSGRNVVAVQPGSATPACVYVVMAHLDSTSFGTALTLAPGADDNASGSAAVLMLAQVLSQQSFACTIRYVLVTGEEQGLYGSTAYANAVRNDPIVGALVLDMVAYNSDTQAAFELITRTTVNGGTADLPLSAAVKNAVSSYAIPIEPQDTPDDAADSDHASFWDVGVPAILVIEDLEDFNPNYHKTSDTLNTLDLVYYTNIVKAVAGALADLANQDPLPHHFYLPTMQR
jgi:Zn-dependent M28 family amino/carboxypeptidase